MKVDINNDTNHCEVVIDSSDCWDLDFTLSSIIHPALVKFKEEETGCCSIDKEDVPEYLHSTYGTAEEYAEKYSHDAWIWVIDEMIWAFGETASGNLNEPIWTSSDEFKKYKNRKSNGHRLFGKYLSGLWN
ncbi:hypothetical protein D3C87_323300 [compost metagenome]